MDPFKVYTNHSKTWISLVTRIFIVLFRLISWKSPAFLTINRKYLLSVSTLDCVITGLGQSSPLLNSANSHWSCSLRTMLALLFGPYRQIRQSKHRIVQWRTRDDVIAPGLRRLDTTWASVPGGLADHPDFCCTLALQRTQQRLASSFPCLALALAEVHFLYWKSGGKP